MVHSIFTICICNCSGQVASLSILNSMGIFGSKEAMDDTEKKVRAEIDEQIKKYKVFMISKASCPFCKTAKVCKDFMYLSVELDFVPCPFQDSQ